MSIQDKVTGRLKQAAGDLTGDKNLRNEGAREERKSQAKRELHEAEQRAEQLRDEIARLEYGSSSEGASLQNARDERTEGRQRPDPLTDAPQSTGEARDPERRGRH